MTQIKATIFAILAAVCYAISIPLSKIFLVDIGPKMMASFLYLGAGIGLIIYVMFAKICKKDVIKNRLTKKEMPYTIWMIILDIIAPILLMYGITLTSASNASLLNNFEIVATSLIAFMLFKEFISKKLTIAIILVVIASIILGFDGDGILNFNIGSLFIIGACICWGFENNCTKQMSDKSSIQIVIIKGIFSGLGSLIIALLMGEALPPVTLILLVLLVGFVAYGLSINFYIMAQKDLGASKTSAYYAFSPFVGVLLSLIILKEIPQIQFYIGLAIMLVATIIMIKDTQEQEINKK